VQYLRHKVLTIIIVIAVFLPLLFFIVAMILELGLGIQVGAEPMTKTQIYLFTIFAILFGVLATSLYLFSNLTIEIKNDGFYYKFFPFHKKFHKITPNDIISWQIKEYRAIADYGGWGIRFGFGTRGKGYIASDNTGVLFIFPNNKKVLFSLKEEEKAVLALEKIFNKIN
jgi:hypothetical protein